MADPCLAPLDPRVRRTRQLLVDALQRLLETKSFEEISIQSIAEAATVNRVTFYDHYPDKFALLQCMVGQRFQELLTRRGVRFDGTCTSALRAMVLGVCDYLAGLPSVECDRQHQLEPHLESAVITVVRGMVLAGLQGHGAATCTIPPEMIATTVSWAILGGAKEWVNTPARSSSEQAADMVMQLVGPIFAVLAAAPQGTRELIEADYPGLQAG